MSAERKSILASVMNHAWQMVRRNGFTMSEALVIAWRNLKLRTAMQKGIVKFYFQKVDSTIREAYGTLKESLLPETKGTCRKANDSLQVYFDTERGEWRSFKRANLLNIIL